MNSEEFLRAGAIKRMILKIGYLFGALFGGLVLLPRVIKSGLRGTFIAIVSLLATGFGFLFQKQLVRGVVRIILEGLFLFYFISFGYLHIGGGYNLEYLNFQFISVVLLCMFLLFHLNALSNVLKNEIQLNAGGETHKGVVEQAAQKLKEGAEITSRGFKSAFVKGQRAKIVLAFLFLGIPQIFQRQIIKGFILFALELAFIFYLVFAGGRDLTALITLNQVGTRSDFSLVYGIFAIMVIVGFIVLYVGNLKNVLNNARLIADGQSTNSFIKDIKHMLDSKFYITSLVLPVLGVIAFTVIPLVFMILIAFTDYSSTGIIPTDKRHLSWIGFGTFEGLLSLGENLKTFLSVLGWTLIWAGAATATCYFGGIFLALLISKKMVKAKTLWRTVFIISMAVPQFVSLLIMRNMFDIYGPVNTFLANTPIGKINFWDNTTLARILIILVNMWIGIPYTMVFSTGILQNIPEELYEAAYMEGSSKFHAFLKITMPYLIFMTGPVLISSVVSNINNFNVIFLLTGGKPLGVGLQYAGGTDILITWLYKLTMQNRLYNMGAAIGILMFILSAAISLSVYSRTSSYKNTGDFG